MESMDNSAQENLRRFFERIERLEDEKGGIAGDIKGVYEEAKSLGYDTKVMRKVIALRKLERQEREELEALTDLYLAALEG